eukprot:TCALIF_09728-PA protein Name:"Protein of unknown function" AED:0.00 eAED:0.00 QI:234/1/0.8/1/0.25/0.2/5/0/356
MNGSSHFDSLESNSETESSPSNHQRSTRDRCPRTLTIRRNQLYDANNVPSNRHNQGPTIPDSEPNPHRQSSDHVTSRRGLSRNGHNFQDFANAKRGDSEHGSGRLADPNGPKGIRGTISSMVTSFKTVFHIGVPREPRLQASNMLNNNSKASFLDNDNSRKGRPPKANKDGRRSTNLRSYQRFGTRGAVRPVPLGTSNRKFYDKLPTSEDVAQSPSRDEASAIVSPMSIDTSTIASTSTPASEYLDNHFLEHWDEEELTCQVCDRSFTTPNLLERHQQKRRHWGCSICECLFDSLMLLEHHKEESEHWSDEGFSDSESESDDWQLDEWRHYQLERMIEMEETAFGPDAQIDRRMLL